MLIYLTRSEFWQKRSSGTGIIIIILVALSFLSFFNRFSRSFSINSDKAAQLEATRNLMAGDGLTIESVDLNDISIVHSKPMIGWPPGYSLLLIALSPFTSDLVTATNVLNVLFLFSYLIISYHLLRKLSIPTSGIVVFYVFTILTMQPILQMTTTDIISFDLFLLLVYLMLAACQNEARGWGYFVVLGLLGFLAAIVKYNMIAFVFFVPAVLVSLGLFSKNKNMFRGGMISGFTMGVTTIGFLVFQKYYTGHYTYLSAYASGGGLHVDNLYRHSPFYFEFLYARDPFKLLPANISKHIADVPTLFTALMLAAVGFMTIAGLWSILRQRTLDIRKLTIAFGGLITIVNVAMLYYLSLTSPQQVNGWTYVEEFRYYGPACFLFLIFCIVGSFEKRTWIRIPVMLVLASSLVFGIANRVYKIKIYGWSSLFDLSKLDLTSADSPEIMILRNVRDVVISNPLTNVVYTDYTSNQRLMTLSGAHVLWDFNTFIMV